ERGLRAARRRSQQGGWLVVGDASGHLGHRPGAGRGSRAVRSATLVVLGRSPVPGAGKSRLRAAMGDGVVDGLCDAFLRDTLAWAGAGPWDLLVAHRGPAWPLTAIAA